MVVWPYLIIHFDSKTVIYCDISNYTLRCTNFSTNLTGISSAWISEYHQAVQVLVKGQKSRIVAYKEGNSPFVIDFSETVYAVVQEGYRIIIWAESGLYELNRSANAQAFSLIKDLGFVPSSKDHLSIVGTSLSYISFDNSLKYLDSGVVSSANSYSYNKLSKYRWGFFGMLTSGKTTKFKQDSLVETTGF